MDKIMIDKYPLYLLCLLLVVFSCTSKQPPIKNIDLEIEFLELYKKIDTLNNKVLALKAQKSLNKADSIYKRLLVYQNKLKTLSSNSGLDIELAENNCVKYFGLDSTSLNEQKVNYLFLFNAYNICGPGYVSCGIGPTITSEKDRIKYLNRLSNARDNYNKYIDGTLTKVIDNVFPEVNKTEMTAFYHSSEVVLKRSNLLNDAFYDSACVYAKKDTVFMKLNLEIDKARFGDL